MPSKLTFLKIFLLSLLFTGTIFWLQLYYSLNFSDTLAEENYIEKSIFEDDHHGHSHDIPKDTITLSVQEDIDVPVKALEEPQQSLPSAADISFEESKQIFFTYIPTTLRDSIKDYRDSTRLFIWADDFDNKIQDLNVEFHAEMVDVRGRM